MNIGKNDMVALSEEEIEAVGGGAIPLVYVVFGAAFALGLTATVTAGAGEIAENGR